MRSRIPRRRPASLTAPAAAAALSAGLLLLAGCGYLDLLGLLGRQSDETDTVAPAPGGICLGPGVGRSVRQTVDGGYIIAGSTGEGLPDLMLIKTDAAGTVQWRKSYKDLYEDYGYSVALAADGGYVVVGSRTNPADGRYDLLLVRTDASGTELGRSTFGAEGADEEGRWVEAVPDGYIIVGSTNAFDDSGDVYLVKTNELGEWSWENHFGGIHSDGGCCVQQTADGGYVIAGVRQDPTAGDDNAYLIKTKPDGTLEWERQFGSHGVRVLEAANCLRHTDGGGYILAGYTNSEGAGDFDAWLIKTDADGNQVWRRTFGGGAWDQAQAVQQTADGGYILAGMTHFRDKDAWLVKTDASGNEEWSKTFGSVQEDWGYAVQQSSDGGYVLVGDTLSFPGINGSGVYLVFYEP